MDALPRTVKSITVLDRTKESGSVGEPLYMDVATTMQSSQQAIILLGGRYGLGSREFTPGKFCHFVAQRIYAGKVW